MKISPVLVPQALLITTGLFGAMTAMSLFAKPGSMLRLGVPLGGGMLMLMACGIAGAWPRRPDPAEFSLAALRIHLAASQAF